MAINKTPKGTWLVDWSVKLDDGKYKRHRQEFPTKREALDFENSGYVVYDSSKKLIREIGMLFLKTEIVGVTKEYHNRVSRALKDFNNYCVYSFNIMYLEDVKYPVVKSFLNSYIGRNTNSTINNKRKVLNQFFDFCVEMEYIEKSPSKRVKALPDDSQQRKVWSDKQISKFLNSIENEGVQFAFQFLFLTGTRPIMATRLSWKDVDWDAGYIYLKHRKGSGGERILEFPMNGKLEVFMKGLYDHAKKQLKHHSNSPVFPNKDGEFRSSNSLRELGRRTLEMLKKKDKSFDGLVLYGLRNTFINQGLEAGVDVTIMQKLVGHGKLSTTQRYITRDSEDIKKAYLKFR